MVFVGPEHRHFVLGSAKLAQRVVLAKAFFAEFEAVIFLLSPRAGWTLGRDAVPAATLLSSQVLAAHPRVAKIGQGLKKQS